MCGAASEEADLIEGHFEARFDVLPGGTGAWQAQSRVNAPHGVPEPAARTWRVERCSPEMNAFRVWRNRPQAESPTRSDLVQA